MKQSKQQDGGKPEGKSKAKGKAKSGRAKAGWQLGCIAKSRKRVRPEPLRTSPLTCSHTHGSPTGECRMEGTPVTLQEVLVTAADEGHPQKPGSFKML